MASISLRNSTACFAPNSSARAMKARISFGRQPPPKPIPACKKRLPILGSYPIAFAKTVMSPPDASQTSAMALINEIFVAKNEFAATFTNSAVGRSALTQGMFSFKLAAYTSFSIFSASSLTTPTTNLFGFNVSSTANPSRKNSGFQARSALGFRAINLSLSLLAVPTGTVDLPTTNPPGLTILAMPSSAEFT